jgi:ABC-2 type transport system ATP-binding protein
MEGGELRGGLAALRVTAIPHEARTGSVAPRMSDAIEVEALTKRFGGVRAVDDLSFSVRTGVVTGFLGPNGAGKTTTLRIVLGLARPTSGTVLVQGRPYAELEHPGRVVGASLERAGFHPGRSGRDHLRALCAMADLPAARADEVLAQVDLAGKAGRRRVGGYSLGMRQRLHLAASLLGDPAILILDEPANGLDPQGIRWLRETLRGLAAEGRTVLVSSHVLSEVAQTADDVVVIARGKLVDQGPVEKLSGGPAQAVVVRAAEDRLAGLAAALEAAGAVVEPREGWLRVREADAPRVGEVALAQGVPLHALYEERRSLEDVFLELTATEEERP